MPFYWFASALQTPCWHIRQQRQNESHIYTAATTTANQPSDYSMRLFGPDMAVTRHNMNVAGTEKGKEARGDYRRMHVFVRRNGQWVVVDSQSVRIDPNKMATK